jgi:cell division protein ZapA (FtsZ GTPase activity inhibitor)
MNLEETQLLRTLSDQVRELREMNVGILAEAAFIHAALNTLLTLQTEADPATVEVYASNFLSIREMISTVMERLDTQQALEIFLKKTQAVPELVGTDLLSLP